MWAILLLASIFLIGAIFKAPEVSREEIQINNEKVRAKREDLKEMHPRKFEFLVADVFQSLGYKATVTPGSNDGGKDIILRKGRETKFVEVKRHNQGTIGRPDIQKFHSALVDANAVGGYFVTLSNFNKNARQYAANKNIELIDGDKLIHMMNS